MNQDIIKMAKEAGFEFDADEFLEPEPIWYFAYVDLERFFHMAQADMKEKCMKAVEMECCETGCWAVKAIRAIGETK